MTPVRFAKMSGAANDFVVLDNRTGEWDRISPDFIRKLCTRRFSIGADGLLLLGTSPDAVFSMRYFNADGSEASMCGNGGRCLARFAVLLGLAPEGREMIFTAPSGRYRAVVTGAQVRLELPPPTGLEKGVHLQLKSGERECDVLNTGVPHAVFFTSDADHEDVEARGREVRYHPRFQPAGTNVNFAQRLDSHRLRVRTYERGVEGETLACGTGSAAAALAAAGRGLVSSPVAVETRSGSVLEMSFVSMPGGFERLEQTGEARLVYWGEWSAEAAAFQEIPVNSDGRVGTC
jgi:diaminopimelate epimerase